MEMFVSIRQRAPLALAVSALIVGLAYLVLVPALAQQPSQPDAGYEFGGQILSRVDDNGRLELCLRTDDGQVVCPSSRFLFPERARANRWIPSSEISWDAPIDPARVIYSVEAQTSVPSDRGCSPDFGRMLGATWKVETTRSFGTAFHIGGGRFVTAHHVTEDRPPFFSLIHGERTIGAVVLGSDPQFDLALLEVVNPELVADIPAMRLRAPTQDDVGQPVYVVGYPGGEALTISGGGQVIQVWDDNIQTSSAIRGGNSGGPMFDACGDVIGVLWAGSSTWAYTYSGRPLQTSLRRITEEWPRWPQMPESVPTTLQAADRLIWHYEAEPPPGVDCSELDGDWWIGLSGIADEAEVRADLERAGWRQIGVCGADGPEDFDNGRTYVAALESQESEAVSPSDCSEGEFFFVDTVLYDDPQTFGNLRLTTSGLGPECPDLRRYSLLVAFDEPQLSGTDLGATLVGADGSQQVGRWQRRSYRTVSDAPDALVTTFWQEWTAPAEFDPVALRLAIGPQRLLLPFEPSPLVTPSEPLSLSVTQRAEIVVRINGATGQVRACVRTDDGIHCPADGGVVSYPGLAGRWRESAPIVWTASLPRDSVSLPEPVDIAGPSCAIPNPDELYAWQFNSLAGTGTAVHVGDRQFIVNGARVPDGAPWGVVSRGELSLPVIRVAHDERNDLALVELFDPDDETDLGSVARFSVASEDLIGSDAHLLSYPAGDAHRYHFAVLNVSVMTDRVLRVEPTGIRRHGAPLIDLCSREVLGVSIGGDDLLRAETVADSLRTMRSEAERPHSPQNGPPAHGSAAAHGEPLYAGPLQPQFSGRICDVHPSERFVTHYAVYASSVDNPDVWQVRDRDGDRPNTCDFGDKIFIVEYRAHERPEAICIEPRRPLSPVSTDEWELEAPDGVELLLVREFPRDDCPGLSTLEQSRWFSTHYFKLRNTGEHEFSDFTVRVVTDDDRRFVPRRDVYTFADSDVWAWRVRVTEGEPVKVLVTVR